MTHRAVLQKIKKALSSAKTALVLCHVDPDADTIGSMIAVSLILRRLKIKAQMVSHDRIPQTYDFLPMISKIAHEIPDATRYDVVITVDAADIRRVGENFNARGKAGLLINIDHHPDNTRFGDINFVAKVSSAAELVYDLCNYLKVPISKDIAVCLYTAIITDTGNFKYENTTGSTFKIASDLLRAGVSPSRIAGRIYDTKSLSSLKVLAAALQRTGVSDDGRVIWTSVTDEMVDRASARGEELTGIVDHLRSVKGTEVALLFREHKGKIKVNLRSKEKVNVQKIAAELGGGGHIRAAGVSLDGSLDDVRDKVLAVVRSHMR